MYCRIRSGIARLRMQERKGGGLRACVVYVQIGGVELFPRFDRRSQLDGIVQPVLPGWKAPVM
jgi:hypothetical protein